MAFDLRQILASFPDEDQVSFTIADQADTGHMGDVETSPGQPGSETGASTSVEDQSPQESTEVVGAASRTAVQSEMDMESGGDVKPEIFDDTIMDDHQSVSTLDQPGQTVSVTFERESDQTLLVSDPDAQIPRESTEPTLTYPDEDIDVTVSGEKVGAPSPGTPMEYEPPKPAKKNRLLIGGVVVLSVFLLVACILIFAGGYLYNKSTQTPAPITQVTELVIDNDLEPTVTDVVGEEVMGDTDVEEPEPATPTIFTDEPTLEPTSTQVPVLVPEEILGNLFPSAIVEDAWLEQYLILDVAYGNGEWITSFIYDPAKRKQGWNAEKGDPSTIITNRYQDGYYITAASYSEQDGWVFVFTQDVGYTDQWWYFDNEFPEEFIDQRWSEDFMITSLAYGDGEWLVIMSENSGIVDQAWNTDDFFNTDVIEERKGEGLYISAIAYGDGLWALIFSTVDGIQGQDWVTGPFFPGDEVDEMTGSGFDISSMTYGNSTWVVVLTNLGSQDDIYWESSGE